MRICLSIAQWIRSKICMIGLCRVCIKQDNCWQEQHQDSPFSIRSHDQHGRIENQHIMPADLHGAKKRYSWETYANKKGKDWVQHKNQAYDYATTFFILNSHCTVARLMSGEFYSDSILPCFWHQKIKKVYWTWRLWTFDGYLNKLRGMGMQWCSAVDLTLTDSFYFSCCSGTDVFLSCPARAGSLFPNPGRLIDKLIGYWKMFGVDLSYIVFLKARVSVLIAYLIQFANSQCGLDSKWYETPGVIVHKFHTSDHSCFRDISEMSSIY